MPEENSAIQILNKVIKGALYLTTFLLPLFFLPLGGLPLGFQKQALLLLLSMIGLGAFLLKVLVQKRVEIKRTFFNYVVLSFVLILAVSTIFSWDSVQSFFGPVSVASAGFLSWLCLVVFFFLLVNNIDAVSEVKKLTTTVLSSASLAGLFGVVQSWGGFVLPWNFTQVRTFNSIGGVNSLALFAAALLPAAITLFLASKKQWAKVGLALFGILGLLLAFIANYWIVWICLGVGMISLVVLLKAIPAYINDGWIVAPVVLLVIAFSFALIGPDFPGLPNLPPEVTPSYQLTFRMARKVFADQGIVRALIGTGPGTFSYLYRLFKPEVISKTIFWSITFQNAPSQLLGLLSTTGILGSLSLLAVMMSFGFLGVKDMIKEEQRKFNLAKALKIGLFSSWMTLAVGKLLYPVVLSLEFLFWLFMGLFIILILSEK